MSFLRVLNSNDGPRKPSKESAHGICSNRYPSILALPPYGMEENSRRWLALREASRRILVEDNLDVFVPQSEVGQWNRLVLNMADSMPQRLEFPKIKVGNFSASIREKAIFHIGTTPPMELECLWLPYEARKIPQDLIQMCSELLLAGYPGCSGCGYRVEEQEWDETEHREQLQNFDDESQIT